MLQQRSKSYYKIRKGNKNHFQSLWLSSPRTPKHQDTPVQVASSIQVSRQECSVIRWGLFAVTNLITSFFSWHRVLVLDVLFHTVWQLTANSLLPLHPAGIWESLGFTASSYFSCCEGSLTYPFCVSFHIWNIIFSPVFKAIFFSMTFFSSSCDTLKVLVLLFNNFALCLPKSIMVFQAISYFSPDINFCIHSNGTDILSHFSVFLMHSLWIKSLLWIMPLADNQKLWIFTAICRLNYLIVKVLVDFLVCLFMPWGFHEI